MDPACGRNDVLRLLPYTAISQKSSPWSQEKDDLDVNARSVSIIVNELQARRFYYGRASTKSIGGISQSQRPEPYKIRPILIPNKPVNVSVELLPDLINISRYDWGTSINISWSPSPRDVQDELAGLGWVNKYKIEWGTRSVRRVIPGKTFEGYLAWEPIKQRGM